MKHIIFLLFFGLILSCQIDKAAELKKLIIAPVLVQESMILSIPEYRKLGFNALVFINAEKKSWSALAAEAHHAGLYALIMLKDAKQAQIEDHMAAALADNVDGFWLNASAELTPTHIEEIQQHWAKLSKKKPSLLGQIFAEYQVAEAMNNPNSFAFIDNTYGRNGSKKSKVIYFNNLALKFFNQYLAFNPDGFLSAPQIATKLVEYNNWRMAFGVQSLTLNPVLLAMPRDYLNPALAAINYSFAISSNDALYFPLTFSSQEDVALYDFDMLTRLFQLRQIHLALSQGKRENISYATGVYVDLKKTDHEQILYIANFLDKEAISQLTYLKKYRLKGQQMTNLLTQETINLGDKNLRVVLQPYEWGLWLIH